MTDFWIVTGREYKRHRSKGDADAECDRLSKKEGGKQFRVMRCKDHVDPSPDSRQHAESLSCRYEGLVKSIQEALDRNDLSSEGRESLIRCYLKSAELSASIPKGETK